VEVEGYVLEADHEYSEGKILTNPSFQSTHHLNPTTQYTHTHSHTFTFTLPLTPQLTPLQKTPLTYAYTVE
jgi:hypothetical protein